MACVSHPVRRLLVVALALLLPFVASPAVEAARDSSGAQGRVVGGSVIAIQSAPWQVYLEVGNGACGGSILTATTVLTAAHCVEDAKVGVPPEQGGIGIVAGLSDLETLPISSTDKPQYREASALRIHPSWGRNASTTGDLAVITFVNPLLLDGATARTVALPPLGQMPVGDELIGTRLSVSGYGVHSSGFPQNADGKLRAATVSVADPQFCDVAENAVTVCGYNPTGSSCQGDSGGPLVIPPAAPGAAPVQVGVVSNGPIGCPVAAPDYYASLWAPEVRAFIDGVVPVPVAPRLGAARVQFSGAPNMREGETISCAPAAFIGATSTLTKITTNTGAVLTAATNGPASAPLTAAQVGQTIHCRSYGASVGGVAVSASMGFTTAVVAAPVVPATPAPADCQERKVAITVSHPSRVRRGSKLRVTIRMPKTQPGAKVLSTWLGVRRSGAWSRLAITAVKLATDDQLTRARVVLKIPRGAKLGSLKLNAAFQTSADKTCDRGTSRTFKVRIVR